MNTALKETLLKDIDIFEEKIHAYKAGQIDRKTYKGVSGGFGSYAQKEEGSMLRLRMPGGRLTKKRLAFLADSVKEHNIDLMKLTTCQTIQLHNLSPDSTVELMKKALDVDIVTRGGGGDFPRNIMVSPLSGVENGEYFDVYPAAEAAAEYLLTLIRTIKLPRKLKIAFSNGPANITHATFRDLGFVARKDDCFDVYCAGGLGPNPKIGVKVADKIEPENVIACIDAMIAFFTTYGDYEKRGRARTRYLQDSLGAEKIKEEYNRFLQEKLKTSQKVLVTNGSDSQSASIRPMDSSVLDKTSKNTQNAATEEAFSDDILSSDHRILAQKQPGLFTVSYHPIGGILPVHMPEILLEAIKDIERAECRIAPDGTLYIINLPENQATHIAKLTDDCAKTPFEYSVSCIGAVICQQGIRDSQGLLANMVNAVRKANLPANALPKVHISGCASSCGTQQIGTLGFQGSAKIIDMQAHSAFLLLFKGNKKQGEENLGEAMGTILEEQIPDFMVELGTMVASSRLDFDSWILENEGQFRELAAKYIGE